MKFQTSESGYAQPQNNASSLSSSFHELHVEASFDVPRTRIDILKEEGGIFVVEKEPAID